MSLIRGQCDIHQRQRADRQRVRMHMEQMWSDAAARKFLDVVDDLERADVEYGHALVELDAEFDKADKLLGPIH